MNLLHKLGEKDLQSTGTVRVNKTDKCPVTSVEKTKKMWSINYDNRQDLRTEIMISRWNDNSVVTIALNCHDIEPLGMAKIWSRADKKSIDITQPFVIDQYNWNKGGVDRVDQNISTYHISIRSRKWWWALFAYLLDAAMQNTWMIYWQTATAPISFSVICIEYKYFFIWFH